MKLKDERIIKFLNKRISDYNLDKEKFLNPSITDLRDAKKMFNMDKAVAKVKDAIISKKKILIYGDYDADGICSSTILYLFLKSKGAIVDTFIPNRFEHGYGFSDNAIEEIEMTYNPDLIITVDLGITAVEEVEILKQEGIDVIITDHHIPLNEIPDCVVIDPKLDPNGTYGFDALCGAGVVLKLVEALSSRSEAMKYVDICAIATVGDIVPLIDENRIIAKFGLEKINKGDTLPSIKLLKKKLKIEECLSSDISFKIVPRLNACGRMDTALKVFDFMIETDPNLLEEKYAEMEKDNITRLSAIEKGINIIDKCLENYNRNEPSVLVCGDFHEGVIGILASRTCHDFNKPAIIFTKDENGNLKGSGRSILGVDIHTIIGSMIDILESFGGHKMACGLEIEPTRFDEFKKRFNEKVLEVVSEDDFIIKDEMYDFEITDEDFNQNFYKELSMLEPFGCDNEKPIIAIKQDKMLVEPINDKAFKHYKFYTKQNNMILAFSSYENTNICKTKSEKLVLLDLGITTYKNKKCLNVISRDVKILKANLEGFEEQDFISALYNKYYSIFDFNNYDRYHLVDNICDVVKQKFSENIYGTMVIATSNDDLKLLEKSGIDVQKYLSSKVMKNGQNVIVANPRQIYNLKDVFGYKNVVFMHKYFNEEHLFYTQKTDVYESKTLTRYPIKLLKDRDVFVRVYKLICSLNSIKANDVLEIAEKFALKDRNLSISQIMFCLIVFMELNFVEFDEKNNCITILNAKKMELNNSKFFNQVGETYDGDGTRVY
ncbi:MAG: single-stranded-DNA-specific exonuclease RecJ [Clostridia bacterium]|nr:single-stranded-DNA-specific exonuclease RecJ [Clostridia bacterium]